MNNTPKHRRRPQPRATGYPRWERSSAAARSDTRRPTTSHALHVRHVLDVMHRALDDVARHADASGQVARRVMVAQAGVATLMEMLA